MLEQEDEVEKCQKTVLNETGLVCICEESIGGHTFINHTPEGVIKKTGEYYLARAEYGPLTLKKSEGLKDIQWFTAEEALELPMYKDVRDIFCNAIRDVVLKVQNKIVT